MKNYRDEMMLNQIIGGAIDAESDPEAERRLQADLDACMGLREPPDVNLPSLAGDTIFQLVEGDRYLLRHVDGNSHRVTYIGAAMMYGSIALTFERADGVILSVTQLDGLVLTIEQL